MTHYTSCSSCSNCALLTAALLIFVSLLGSHNTGTHAATIHNVERRGSAEPLKAIVLGDWGEALLRGQEPVAEGMAAWAEQNHPAYIITTGDNIYPKGLRSPDDNQMNRKWREIYNQTSLVDLDWYVSLGNHDFGDWEGEEWNEIGFGELEPRWILPHLWYDVLEDMGDYSVHWVIIDTESFTKAIERNNYTDMLTWMDTVLSESTADWKIVVGHRHVFTVGDAFNALHGPMTGPPPKGPVTASIFNILVPIMERNGATAYVCGHDHNLQHIRSMSDSGLDYVISGAGGALLSRYMPAHEDYLREYYNVYPLYFKVTYGFVTMTITKDSIVYDYYDQDAVLWYSFTRNHDN